MTDTPDNMPDEASGREMSDDATLAALDFSLCRRVPCLIEGDFDFVPGDALTHYRHALTTAASEVAGLTQAARQHMMSRQDQADDEFGGFRLIWMDSWEMLATSFASSVDDVLDTIDLRVPRDDRSAFRSIVVNMYATARDFEAARRVMALEPSPMFLDRNAWYIAPRLARDGLLDEAVSLVDRYAKGDVDVLYAQLVFEDALADGDGDCVRQIAAITDVNMREMASQRLVEFRIDDNCMNVREPMQNVSVVEAATLRSAILRVLRWDGARARTLVQLDDLMRRYDLQQDKVTAAYEVGLGSGLTLNEASRTVVARVAGPVEQLVMHHGYMLGVARRITRLRQANG